MQSELDDRYLHPTVNQSPGVNNERTNLSLSPAKMVIHNKKKLEGLLATTPLVGNMTKKGKLMLKRE